MKKDIHPQYYPKAEVLCSCGAKFYVGSTKPKMEIEICSHCHPFYTGQKKIVDTTGRVQRFKERMEKTKTLSKHPTDKKTKSKKPSKKKAHIILEK